MTRLLALSLLLAACAAPSEPTAPAPPDVIPPGPPTTDIRVELIEGGLLSQATPSGPTQLVTFGSALDRAVSAVTDVLGEPDDRGTNEECGAGPVDFVNWPDISLLSQNDQFGGWALSDRTADAASIRFGDGIGIGSTRADVDAAGGEMYLESTLGDEFAIGDVSGMLDAPDGTVTDLWAGLSCTFR